MRRLTSLAMMAALLLPATVDAQTARKGTAARKAPASKAQKAPATKKEAAAVKCPAVLGTGVKTQREFCDILTGRDPAGGALITIPPHKGVAVLSFDLHNRHTYSEEQVRAKKSYAEYTATVGALTPTGDLLGRGVVYSTFRTAADLVDRVDGGAGPGGVKAVAPTGTEPIVINVPADVTQVSILGERLVVKGLEGEESFVSPGRPIAILSNVKVDYTPAPAAKKKAAPARSKKK